MPPGEAMAEYGWVIEAGWTAAPKLKYWSGCTITGGGGVQHSWRLDHIHAVRFSREQDAKKIARTLIDGESYRVVEHAWTHALSSQDGGTA